MVRRSCESCGRSQVGPASSRGSITRLILWGSWCSWSRNNRYLLSCSLDSTAIIWDLSLLAHPLLHPRTPLATSSKLSSSSSRVQTIRFDAPVASAEFHPRNSKIVLATLTCNEVVLVDLREGRRQVVLEDTANDDEEMDVDAEDRPSRTKSVPTLASATRPHGSNC